MKALAALVVLVPAVFFSDAVPGMSAQTPAPRASPAAPCGFVSFRPTGHPRYRDGGTMEETIAATVSFPDGHTETATFPYPWIYPNGEQTDPWSNTNLKRPDFAVPMQLPPPGTNVSTFAPVLRYVLEHTGHDGFTNLVDCPRSPSMYDPAHQTPPAATVYTPLTFGTPVPSEPASYAFVDESAPDAPVKIVEAKLYLFRRTATSSTGLARDCVTFWNRSKNVVTAVRFSFTHFEAAGALKLIQPFERSGSFAPGAVVEGPRRAQPVSRTESVALKNCRSFLWSGDPGANRVAVTSVEFADGSAWAPGTHGT